MQTIVTKLVVGGLLGLGATVAVVNVVASRPCAMCEALGKASATVDSNGGHAHEFDRPEIRNVADDGERFVVMMDRTNLE